MNEPSAILTLLLQPDNEPDAAYPLARRLDAEARQQEVTVLLQFFIFHEHLAALLRAAAAEGMHLIVLKGAALAETIYPRPGLRPFGDLDVLARPSDADRVRCLLERLKYVVDPDQWNELASSRIGEANFFKQTEQGPIVVELHTDLINNDLFWGQIRVDNVGLWERAQAQRLAGVEAWVLGPEDQLLHLCLHLAGHYLAAPQSLRDIDQLCRTVVIDWPFFAALTRKAGAAAACFSVLFAAATLLGTAVPTFLLDDLAPRVGRKLLQRCAQARAADVTQAHTEKLRPLLLWFLLGTFRARFNALRGIIFPSRLWLVKHYYHDLFADSAPGRRLVLAALYRAHWKTLLRKLAHLFWKSE